MPLSLEWTLAQRRSLRKRLLHWYARHARDLPWRRTRDPYCVWLSEVMLQQTQVEAVKPYFDRFVAAFPNVAALAAAQESQVLRLWEGLGYYRRARGLHAAAKRIVSDYGGHFPRDAAALMELPGIGRYTAGAIASIAFDRPEPILEANTIRLFCRLLGYRDDPTRAAGKRLLWQTASELVPSKDASLFNQALMELGSLVCTPRAPLCDACPLARFCAAHRQGLEQQIPALARKQKYTSVHEAAVAVVKRGRVLLRQCGEGERWAGLWDFPRVTLDDDQTREVREELVAKVLTQTGVEVELGEKLTTIQHGVTRYRIRLDCYAARFRTGRIHSTIDRPVRWAARSELESLPLSVTGRTMAGLIP